MLKTTDLWRDVESETNNFIYLFKILAFEIKNDFVLVIESAGGRSRDCKRGYIDIACKV